MDTKTSDSLSVFSQAPDDYVWLYSAVPVAIWGVVDLPYRHRIMNTLHSLHGGKNADVLLRRSRLAGLIKQADLMSVNDHWKIGFLIHALGDSYAHVHGDDGNLEAYGEFAGHAVDSILRRDGDNIDHKTIGTYVQYTSALFCSLARPVNTDKKMVSDFSEWMSRTKLFGTVPWNIDPKKKLSASERQSTERWLAIKHVKDVDNFLMRVQAQLEAPVDPKSKNPEIGVDKDVCI